MESQPIRAGQLPTLTDAGDSVRSRADTKTHETGLDQRTVVVEFDSLDQAVAARDSSTYQIALEALGDGAERDIRLVEGV